MCSAMGAGEARDMSKQELIRKDGLKLIPWASVAARIPGSIRSIPGMRSFQTASDFTRRWKIILLSATSLHYWIPGTHQWLLRAVS